MAFASAEALRFPTFSDSRNIRLLVGTLLYLAQGFPQGVVFLAIPTWLAVADRGAVVVGAVATAGSLPWVTKFIIGAVIDRYTFIPMGRRRPWLVGSQICIAAGFLVFAALSPAPDETAIIVGFTFLISLLTAIQDVALDAMVIDLTPADEIGRLNGFMFAGKLLGLAGGMAVTGYFTQYYGIRSAMVAMFMLFAIPALASIAIRERPREKFLPWSAGTASADAIEASVQNWIPLLRLALGSLLRRDTVLLIALLIIYGVHQVLYEQGQTLFATQQLGWQESATSNLGAVQYVLFAGFSMLLGGWVIDRYGPRRIALIAGLAGPVIIGLFAMSPAWWHSDGIYVGWVLASGVWVTLFYLAFLVMTMRVSAAKVAATSFALVMATLPLGQSIGGYLLGVFDKSGGFAMIFGMSALLMFFASLLPLFMSHQASGAKGKTARGSE